jgi:hypothetical protein
VTMNQTAPRDTSMGSINFCRVLVLVSSPLLTQNLFGIGVRLLQNFPIAHVIHSSQEEVKEWGRVVIVA